MSDRVNHRDMSYITETVTETVTKTVAKTITKNITETVDTTYKIDTTTKDDYQCCNETLEETYQVQRCFKVEKVVFIGDYGVNKDPYNHLKHPEPELANDDDKYYYATELEDEDADEDARIDYLWELLSRWQRLTNIQVEAADAASRAAADAISAIQEAFQHEVRVRVDQRADHVRDNQ